MPPDTTLPALERYGVLGLLVINLLALLKVFAPKAFDAMLEWLRLRAAREVDRDEFKQQLQEVELNARLQQAAAMQAQMYGLQKQVVELLQDNVEFLQEMLKQTETVQLQRIEKLLRDVAHISQQVEALSVRLRIYAEEMQDANPH